MRTACLCVTLVFCLVTPASLAAPNYEEVLIKDVPYVRQKPDFCGEACAEMAFRKLGRAITQDQVFDASGLDPALGRGCYTAELNTALRRLGVRTGDVWYRIDPTRSTAQIEDQWRALHADLLRGVPSIVCMHYSDRPDTTEHFRLVLGYRPDGDELVYHEPAESDGAYRKMPRRQFLKLWPLDQGANGLVLIRLCLEPGKIITPPAAKGFA